MDPRQLLSAARQATDPERLMWSATRKAWEQLSRDIGAEFEPPQDSAYPGTVTATVGDWIVTLDVGWARPTVSILGSRSGAYTVLEAPYDAKDDFGFLIRGKTVISAVGKVLGFKGVETGDPDFDRDFFVKSSDETKVRILLANVRIRQLIQSQGSSFFKHAFTLTTDDPLAVATEDTSLLFLEPNFFPLTYPGGEIERLKSCVQLLGEMLDELRRMGSAAPVEDAEQESIPQTT